MKFLPISSPSARHKRVAALPLGGFGNGAADRRSVFSSVGAALCSVLLVLLLVSRVQRGAVARHQFPRLACGR
jgi:hypothetical protein